MISIREATLSDETCWDTYVEQHVEHSPYHLFGWQKAVKEAYHHQGHYLIAEQYTNRIKEIVGVFPLILFRKPLGKPTFCALPFCDIGGILANDTNIRALLITESKKIAFEHQAKYIEIRTRTHNSNQSFEAPTNKDSTEKVSMLLSLPENSELLFSSFKSKLRSQIRKAEKNGLSSKIGSDKIMLDDFYRVFAHNMRALGSPVHAKEWFLSLFDHYKDKMLISIVYKDEQPVGAGIVLIAGKKAAIPWASTKAEYNRLSPNMMLYWSLLEHISNRGVEEFDFGRSSFGEGTYKFKKQWGAEPVHLDWFQISNDQNITATSEGSNNKNQLREVVERIWRKLPLTITTFIGPKIRKYISL
jgi:FemAB-related protein (PEP-CTERM system-associated)